MLDRNQLMEYVDGCRGELAPSEIRALFLIGIEGPEDSDQPVPTCDEIAERVSDVLSKTFYSSDVTANWATRCKRNGTRLAAFLSGPLTEKMLWRKARMLRTALMLALEDFSQVRLSCDIGVYIALDASEDAEQIIRRSQEALHRAMQEENGGCWVCSTHAVSCRENREESNVPARDAQYEAEEWLRFLTRQTDSELWEVDLRTRVFRMFHERELLDGRSYIYENFPDTLIENGKVHQRSAEAFRRFAKGMLAGNASDRGNFILQHRQNMCYGWATLSYHLLYDANGRPYKAQGRKEDILPLPDVRAEFALRRPMPSGIYPHLYCYLQANLTQNTVERIHFEGQELARLARCWSYDEAVRNGLRRVFNNEDTQRLREYFSREGMLERFEKGERWSYERCRTVDIQGRIQWISVGVNLARDPDSDAVCLFAYFSETSERHRWECLSSGPMQVDAKTGLYDLNTARAICTHMLEQEEDDYGALVVICVGGLKDLPCGECSGRIAQNIMTALNVLLGVDCIVAQYQPHQLVVFYPKAPGHREMRQRLDAAMAFVRISMADVPEINRLRFVCGAMLAHTGASFDGMTASAARLCHLHADAPSDWVAFLRESEEPGLGEMLLGEEAMDRIDYRPLDTSQELNEADKSVAMACYEQMLHAEGVETSINGVLRILGLYYQADRTYILTVSENGQFVTMLNEWFAEGKYSIQQSFSGKRIEAFPVLKRYRRNPLPVLLLNGERSATHMQQNVGKDWRYMVVPMSPRAPEQYFCMENPRVYYEHTALLHRVLPRVSSERNRLLSTPTDVSPMEKFLSLPNARAYMNVVYSLDSDLYSSVGALTADIPGLTSFKTRHGNEEGGRVVVRLSEVLLDVFGSSLIFHTRETEFVVLCTDMGYETFCANCRHARQLLEHEYAGQYRMGYTWSDGVFSARDLVAKARSIMHYSTPATMMDMISSGRNILRPKRQKPVGTIETDLWGAGRFTIFLQPKVHMGTGELAGAEALVRIFDHEGRMLPHMRIIQEMEQKGTIQELDYFVFDQMLRVMDDWQQRGYELVTMSSNFSRNTLLNDSALASLLAISSRYPDVPLRKVELEITETAGDLGKSTFSELMKQFHEFGFQFSLDDFGSSYSNMSMLANLRFRSVKLDRSMIASITQNHVSRMMIQDIIRICHECGMICIAEGVETEEQVEVLLAKGCVYAQGYYYDKPLPLEEFENKYYKNRTSNGRRSL